MPAIARYTPNTLSLAIAASLTASLASTAFPLEPASLTKEGPQVVPVLNVDLGYNDNVSLVETGKTGSMFTVLQPSITVGAEREDRQYQAVYAIKQTNFQNSTADNTTDHSLTGRAYMEFSRRSRLDLNAAYLVAHEGRGSSGLSVSSAAEPTEYNELGLNAAYEYGGKEATGRFRFTAGTTDREYQNNGQQTKDKRVNTFSSAFYYKVAPKTSLLAEYAVEDNNYDNSTANSNSTETEYLLGAEWDATAKTSGTLKLGYAEKDFADATPDASGFTWKADVRWSPRAYSTFDLSTAREENETDGTGDYIENSDTFLVWTHGWTDKTSTRLSLGRSLADYQGGSTREDTTNTFGIGADFDYQRWLNFSADYTRAKKSSSDPSVDEYTNNILMFRVIASF